MLPQGITKRTEVEENQELKTHKIIDSTYIESSLLYTQHTMAMYFYFVLSCISDASLFYHPGSLAMYCIRVPPTGWVTEAVPWSSRSKEM